MRYILIILCASVPLYAFSLEDEIENRAFVLDCTELASIETENFSSLSKKAAEVDRILCESLLNVNPAVTNRELISDRQQRALLAEFSTEAKRDVSLIAREVNIRKLEIPFKYLSEKIAEGDIYSKQLPSFSLDLVEVGGENIYKLYFSNTVKTATFRFADNKKCQVKYSKDCDKLFDEYGNVVNQYKSSYTKLTTNETIKQLDALSLQWDRYLGQARSQTTLELLLTTWLEGDHFKQGRLVGPPKRQWSLLHPSVVYEYLDAGQSGDNYKMGVAVEWLGVNWWDKNSSPIGIPFGVSLSSSYNSWVNNSNVGHGLMFHFYNSYSIGWSTRDGEDSFYVSIDLLKAVMDKKKTFEMYKSQMGDI
ncbi:hypothetical protein MNBD_GAMMA21-1041 [hydrothermal vent metagenome]|uniref:Uncharacterized protein n=1 Tax=hydrothermal vent metagenome TaxID=652676 RepID=A0A3B0ZSK5_9ZZZZ